MLENKLKSAFDAVQAEEELKANTKDFLHRQLYGGRRKTRAVPKRLAACFVTVFLCVSGYFAYFTPVAAVSIDINPSLELAVNRFDRVIDVTGYNADGQALAEELSLRHMNYEDAVNAVTENEMVAACLAAGETLEITVAGTSEERTAKMEHCLSQCAYVTEEQVHCAGHWDEVEHAHEAGLSLGKYRAYLAALEEEPDLTLEEAQDMTMRELRERTECDSTAEQEEHGNGQNQQKGHGNGMGHGKHHQEQ
ncbi:hypothetical protein H9X85_06835 [Anaerotignum lactatifermentans]|uniref:Anti-sigma factor RsgI-like middle domain-containing protein n=1 Tax=Anaerotignum lactatifermentans TaxID=160404 RepID=A0ABS2G9J4_9FIRM|nr:hypothetical protein [Anaerotignum lactatifermentans]MBM6829354.1 hypothetical protein [Anaerotignum lactatifermentans]MBM6877405.1 hypothetical protein [Anaerotignum lactatifermentans]MBM6950931.1 hypothetical protein [Anaerotignum lactatifermentans]